MSTVSRDHEVDDEGLAALRRPRRDLVREEPDGPDAYVQAVGPFQRYRRQLTVEPIPEPDDRPEPRDPGPAGRSTRYRVGERTEFRLAVPVWWPLLTPLMRRALAGTDRKPRARFWWPEEVVLADTARLMGVLCTISVMTGYLGVIIGQTITFAAQDFGAGDGAQANTLAAVRVGVLLSFLLLGRADRYGRRPLILGLSVAAVAFTTLGSLAPDLFTLGASQTVARGLTTGLITLLMLTVAEEVPAASRAFAISLTAVSAALGAGMVVWVLPVADVIDGGWRAVYVVPVLFLPVVLTIGRSLPETRRFTAASDRLAPGAIDRGRLALLGVTAFASLVLLSPASQLRNEFLNDDLGFSAGEISLFQILVSTPAGIVIVAAGVAADRVGRRWIGGLGLGLGAAMIVLSYQVGGLGLWLAASAGVILTSAAFPALRGYQTELFPTRARARVGGILDVVGVAGSATGLVIVGYLAERWDDLGTAIAVVSPAALIAALLILLRFPETAGQELEAFNPDDPRLDRSETDTDTDTDTETASTEGS